MPSKTYMNIIDICLKEKWSLYNMFESIILLYILESQRLRVVGQSH